MDDSAPKEAQDSAGAPDPDAPLTNPAAAVKTLARLDARIARVQAELREKEELMLNSVFKPVPKPICDRWKIEANDIFAALVTLKQRRLALRVALRKSRPAA